jgi:hypothetical protein
MHKNLLEIEINKNFNFNYYFIRICSFRLRFDLKLRNVCSVLNTVLMTFFSSFYWPYLRRVPSGPLFRVSV